MAGCQKLGFLVIYSGSNKKHGIPNGVRKGLEKLFQGNGDLKGGGRE